MYKSASVIVSIKSIWARLHSPAGGRAMNRSLLPAAIGFIGVFLLAGCGSVPPVEPPATGLTMPPEWTATRGEPPAAATEPAAQVSTGWWLQFRDPALDSMVREALTHNHDLEAAAARLDAASARARIAGADQLPTLDLGVTGSRRWASPNSPGIW